MICWLAALALTIALPWAVPAWWWVMVVPFAWGLTSRCGAAAAFVGGAALGAVAWGGAAGIALAFGGAGPAATRVAALLRPLTGGHPLALVAWTAAVAALAAAVAALAGHAVAPGVTRRTGDPA